MVQLWDTIIIFSCPDTYLVIFFLKIILYSIYKRGNKLWAKPGNSQLATEGEEKTAASCSPPFPQKFHPQSQLQFTLQGPLLSGAYSPVGDGRSEVTITMCYGKCCRSHLNLWREPIPPEQGICHWRLVVGLAFREVTKC